MFNFPRDDVFNFSSVWFLSLCSTVNQIVDIYNTLCKL